MNISFIILAGGESKRFNSKIPKPYHLYKGKPLLMHSVDRAKSYKKFKKILVVVNKNHVKFINKLKIQNVKIITGGKTRAESAYKGLNKLKYSNTKYVMIHDAARPNFSLKLLDKLKNEIKLNNCVVPAIQTADSVKQKIKGRVKNLKRENIYFMQTPQAFNYNKLFKLQKNKGL